MQTRPPFLPDTLGSWIALIGLLATWITTAAVAWNRMMSKVNGLGDRLNDAQAQTHTLEGRMQAAERLQYEASRDRADMHERMGRVEKGVDACSEKITEGLLVLGSAISELKNVVLSEDAKVRERVARVETLVMIEKKIGRRIPED